MTSGQQPYFWRSSRIRSQCAGSMRAGRHMRGLEEKIWKVFAPMACARSAAMYTPPEVERCIPMRKLFFFISKERKVVDYTAIQESCSYAKDHYCRKAVLAGRYGPPPHCGCGRRDHHQHCIP